MCMPWGTAAPTLASPCQPWHRQELPSDMQAMTGSAVSICFWLPSLGLEPGSWLGWAVIRAHLEPSVLSGGLPREACNSCMSSRCIHLAGCVSCLRSMQLLGEPC